MFKIIMLIFFTSVVTFAGNEFSILYKVEKASKKLGFYEVNLGSKNISSNSYGAASRLEMFSTKTINYTGDGIKEITFTKNKKSQNFNVVTKLSALDKDTKKKYDRKLKKVEGNDMLLITAQGSNGIELFNKRATVVKTIDEFLSDIYFRKLDYDKFILFDKLGVMKMVADVKKEKDSIIIENSFKNKPYMKIVLKDSTPVELRSLVSNWNLKLEKSGVFKEYEVDLGKILAKSYSSKLKGSIVKFKEIKKVKKYYNLKGTISFLLPDTLVDGKKFKQISFCKKELKRAKIKNKNVSIENAKCVADIRLKENISDLKKDILDELVKEHEQLRITKKIKFKKDSIVYGVL